MSFFYDLDELHTLLPECDALVLALPLSKQTQCIIGQAELSAMRPHAFLINIGRGALIEQNALIAALQEQRLGGAALDVTAETILVLVAGIAGLVLYPLSH